MYSSDGSDFIYRMLKKDPKQRSTAHELRYGTLLSRSRNAGTTLPIAPPSGVLLVVTSDRGICGLSTGHTLLSKTKKATHSEACSRCV